MIQAENQPDQIETLNQHLLMHLDEKVIFQEMSHHIHREFDEFKAQVFQLLPNGDTLLRSENGKVVKNGLIYKKGQGLSSYVARMKKSYYSNSKRDPLLSFSQRHDSVESEIAVPIIIDGTVLGSVHVLSANEQRKFSEQDALKITEFISKLEAPLRNIKLFLMAKNLNDELLKKLNQKEQELEMKGRSTSSLPALNLAKQIQMIGHSNSMVEVFNMAKRVSNEDFPVMIVGPSGVGKKMLARKIHSMGPRVSSECVTVHCSALEESQLEFELFGKSDRPGAFERANGGTLILDGIESMGLNLQAKLLRTLLSGEIYNIDSNIPKPVNVRVISCSAKNLSTAVEEKRFRDDLLYRLNIVSINVPALNERGDDIKNLSEHFLNLGREKEDYKVLTGKAVDKILAYSWPGNIQELRNVMERTYIMVEGRYIEDHHLPNFMKIEKEVIQEESFSEMSLHDLEKRHIIKTLDHLGGNKTRAAKSLGITVKTLYNKLHSYGLVQSKKSEA